ncbi:Capsular polysaccharide biosynthesis protein [Blastococcus aurantiacus]|uniref:Capsular polysaccharide biosynthesis protein n=1 Tax=Blastococcus aurantiacus TaxID=1550231 RepID=A0A1G7MSK0_9ACTN|nr:hypothetical protein [Blastococcus aurantiacus]SDF64687.1 Capsular polysaccharide biosynthesis protein [Blastococcus aurantiacus]
MKSKGGSQARSEAAQQEAQQEAPVTAPAQAAPPTAAGTRSPAAALPTAADRRAPAPAAWSSRRRTSRSAYVVLPLLGAVALGAGVLAYEAQRSPQYTSEALVAVLPEDPGDEVSLPITSIWVGIADSDTVRDRMAPRLDVSRAALDDGLTIGSSDDDAPLVTVRATTGDPETSAAWANAVAAELLAESDLHPISGYTLDQVTDARPPGAPDQFPTVPLVGGAVVVGLLAGAGAAQLVDRRARRRARPTPA